MFTFASQAANYLARQLYDFDQIVLCTFLSPYPEDRDAVRELFPEWDFLEGHVDVSLAEARRRDPKGLYTKVDSGEITGFTGSGWELRSLLD